jgi:uncharacterized protein (TIGR03435 family)
MPESYESPAGWSRYPQLQRSWKVWWNAQSLDKTGLNGNYDFKLSFCMEGLVGLFQRAGDPPRVHDQPCDNAESLFSAVQVQLGLKLESKKDPIDVFVIDHINKIPKVR